MATRQRTRQRTIAEVLSNVDTVECILASFGANAPKAGRACRLWLEAAQRAVARCRVVELEASIGERWNADEYFEGDPEDPEHRVQDYGLQIATHGSMVATPTGLLVSDCNNSRVLILDAAGQPKHEIVPGAYPGLLAYGFDSIFVTTWVEDVLDPGGNKIWTVGRVNLSGDDIGFPSPPRARCLALVGDSLFVGMGCVYTGHTEDDTVQEYDAATASFVRVFCKEPAHLVMSMAGLGETLLVLAFLDEDAEESCEDSSEIDEPAKDAYVSTYSLKTAELWARCAVPAGATCVAAQHDRLFVATPRQRHERGALHIMLLDGTPLQKLEVHATGGPTDLCVAHGKLYCLCTVDYSEEDLFTNDDVEEFTPLGGDEEMHALCLYNFVGAAHHF